MQKPPATRIGNLQYMAPDGLHVRAMNGGSNQSRRPCTNTTHRQRHLGSISDILVVSAAPSYPDNNGPRM